MNRLVVPVAWSLAFELYFYCVFSLSFMLKKRTIGAISITLLLLLSYKVCTTTYNTNDGIDFITSPFMIEFLYGVILFFLYERIKQGELWIVLVSVISCFACYYYGFNSDSMQGAARVFSLGLGSFFLVLTAILLERARGIIAPRFMVNLGNSSYTLYLSHGLLLSLFYYLGVRDYLFAQGVFWVEIGFFCYLFLIIVFSHIIYSHFENPIYRTVRNFNFRQQLTKQFSVYFIKS